MCPESYADKGIRPLYTENGYGADDFARFLGLRLMQDGQSGVYGKEFNVVNLAEKKPWEYPKHFEGGRVLLGETVVPFKSAGEGEMISKLDTLALALAEMPFDLALIEIVCDHGFRIEVATEEDVDGGKVTKLKSIGLKVGKRTFKIDPFLVGEDGMAPGVADQLAMVGMIGEEAWVNIIKGTSSQLLITKEITEQLGGNPEIEQVMVVYDKDTNTIVFGKPREEMLDGYKGDCWTIREVEIGTKYLI